MTEEQFNNLAQKYKAEAPLRQARQNAQQAIKNNDYTDWSEAINTILEYKKAQINQKNFDKIVQIHQNFLFYFFN